MVFNTYEYIEFQHLVRSRDGFINCVVLKLSCQLEVRNRVITSVTVYLTWHKRYRIYHIEYALGFNGLVHISSWWMLVIYWPQFPRDSGRWSIIWLQSSNFNEFNTKTVDNLEWSLTMTWIMYTIPVCTARVYSICFKQPEYPNHAYVLGYHHGICNMFVPIIIYVHASLHKFFITLHKFWLVWKKYYVIMYT